MEMTNHELNSTPEFRNHLFSLIGIQITGFLLTALFIFLLLNGIDRNIDNRLFTAAARIETRYPESLQDIIPVLIGESSETERLQGQQLFESLGYSAKTPIQSKPVYRKIIPHAVIGFILISIMLFTLNYLIYYNHQKKLFGRISRLSNSINSILDGKPVFIKSGHSEGIWNLFTDRFNQMVKRMQASAEMLAGDREFLSNIISDISHQLKTPMASLIMYNELMLNEPGMKKTTRREFLSISRCQLSRMEWLIKSLLKLARIESGTINFDKKSHNPAESVSAAVKSLEYLRNGRRLPVSDKRKSRQTINGDKNWLIEAFANIIKNALQHTDPESGKIDISITDTALFLRIIISDNGPGIPEALLPRIFERFFKGGNATDMENVGIGLHLSKMIIEAHEGDIRVNSSAGMGSEFIITLPY